MSACLLGSSDDDVEDVTVLFVPGVSIVESCWVEVN